jgi:hypothetical protein
MRFALPENSPLPAAYTIVACQRCGSVHADTPGSQADYDRYYSEFSRYEDPSIATGGGDSESDAQRIFETTNRLIPFLTIRGGNVNILDIGCARGGILKALRQNGFSNLHGMDPSPACTTHLLSQGIQASCGALSDLDSLGEYQPFDLIILSHVLEHLLDVSLPIRHLRSLLASNGLLYVEVPDASRYVDNPAVPFYYFDCEHINHFSKETLDTLATLHGFKVITGAETDIVLPNRQHYPAVWALFEIDPSTKYSTMLKPARLAEKVEDYIEQSHLTTNYPELEELAHNAYPVLLWGAGSFAQRLLEDSPLMRCRIVSVVDQDKNKQGRHFAGTIISNPEDKLKTLTPDTVIVIAAALHSSEICERIHNFGFAGEIVVLAKYF